MLTLDEIREAYPLEHGYLMPADGQCGRWPPASDSASVVDF